MAQDLTSKSDDELSRDVYYLTMDSQHYQDREQDHGEDHSATLAGINNQLEAIDAELERRDLEVQAERNAYERMVEA